MYEQIRGDVLFCMFYAAVAILPLVASFYLLFRRGNAFAPDITPPVRLRRWAAALFAALSMSHVWYMPILFLSSYNDIKLSFLIGALLDSMTVIPLSIIVLLVMLQDCRRPLWPVVIVVAPLVVMLSWCVINCSDALFQELFVYSLLLSMGVIIYMMRAMQQYGRWLRDNYADLEHKEIWQSSIVLIVILLLFVIYASSTEVLVYQYSLQILNVALIYYLLWRVETLSDLSLPVLSVEDGEEVITTKNEKDKALSSALSNDIRLLLEQHCEKKQLYLQHDISVVQLAKLIGTNRVYLGKYFSSEGITYNSYINGLRIRHFINLYRETVAARRPLIIKQLSYQSGFRSYSTFSVAFKQIMGKSATEWMRNIKE